MIKTSIKLFKLILSIPFITIIYILVKSSSQKDIILKDLAQYGYRTPSFKNFLYCFLYLEKCFRNVVYFRLGYNKSFLFKLIYKENSSLHIKERAKIKGGLLIVHGDSTYIYADEIGENCYINQGVTIGVINKNAPIIGDNVRIATSALVLGEITIGSNTTIGAGAVIVKDVPPNSVVVGNPARIVKLNGKKVNIKL